MWVLGAEVGRADVFNLQPLVKKVASRALRVWTVDPASWSAARSFVAELLVRVRKWWSVTRTVSTRSQLLQAAAVAGVWRC